MGHETIRRVLSVEDEPTIMKLLEHVVNAFGGEHQGFNYGGDFQRHSPYNAAEVKLITCDGNFPWEMGGSPVLNMHRVVGEARRMYGKVPIIGYTGSLDNEKDKDQLIQLLKPYDNVTLISKAEPKKMIAAVRNILSS